MKSYWSKAEKRPKLRNEKYQEWNEKYQEAEISKECAQHWKGRYESLRKESLGWMNEKKHLNGLLDTYEKSINILSPVVAM